MATSTSRSAIWKTIPSGAAQRLGNGQFNAATTYAVGKQPYWIASGDLNGDGYPDLVTANTTDGTVSVLLNNGNGNGTFAAAVPYTVGKQPYQVAIGDLNGDGSS